MKTCFDIPDAIDEYALAVVPVGSRITCNPPPTDTDQDLLVLIEEQMYSFVMNYLEKKGWEHEGDDKYTEGDFESFRKTIGDTEYNIILAYSERWFNLFLDATLLCKKENALKKERRIAIFKEIYSSVAKPSLATLLTNGLAAVAPEHLQIAPDQVEIWANEFN